MSRPKPSDVELAHEFDGRQFYDEAGVDLSLVWDCLALTPTERLRDLQATVRSLDQLRNATTRTKP